MKKTVFGLVLGAVLLFTTICPSFIVEADEISTGSQSNIVKSVDFLANGKPVHEGDTVSLDDEFQVEYRLQSPIYLNYPEEEKEEGNYYLKQGDEIELPKIMSTGFDLSNIGSFGLDLDDGTNFGTVSVSSDGEVKLTVNYSEHKDVNDVVAGIAMHLDKNVVNVDEEFTFEIPGVEPKTVTVKVEESQEEEPTESEPEDVSTLSKDGGVFDSTGKANWKVNFSNNGRDLQNVVLYDFFAVDSGINLEILTDSLQITDEAGNLLEEGKDYTFTYDKDSVGQNTSGKKYSFKLELGNMSREKNYTISYDTQINNYDDYLMDIHKVPVNHVWAEYSYLTENSDEPVQMVTPDVEKKGTGNNVMGKSAIDKYLLSSDPATHQLTWKIFLNKNHRALTNVIATEKLGEGQKLVSISDITIKKKNGQVVVSHYEPEKVDETTYKFNFGDDLNGSMAVFTVVTELDEEEVSRWEANPNKYYNNDLSMVSDQHAEIPITAWGRCRWKESVLEKSASIDKQVREVDYTVNINGAGQLLPERLQIKDTLGDSLTFVEDSVKLYIGVADAEGNVTSTDVLETGYTTSITQEGDNEILTITLPEKQDNRSCYVLTYSAKPTEISPNGDYTNKVQLLGYGYEKSEKDEVILSYKSFGGGWVTEPTKKKNDDVPEEPKTPETPEEPKKTIDEPETPKSGGDSSSNSSSSSSSSSNEVVGFGEDVIAYTTNKLETPEENMEEEKIQAGDRLAKTGGFAGTVLAYLAGVGLVAAGIYVIKGKKKSC